MLLCSFLFIYLFIYLLYKRLEIQEWKNKFVNLVVSCSRRVRVREVCLLVATSDAAPKFGDCSNPSTISLPLLFISYIYSYIYYSKTRLLCCSTAAVGWTLAAERYMVSSLLFLFFFFSLPDDRSANADRHNVVAVL